MLLKSVGGVSLTVEEIDGGPSIARVAKILINNGTLTDMGGGIAKILLPTDIDGGNFTDTYLATNDIDGGVF